MIEKEIPSYQSHRVLQAYRLTDLFVPILLLICLHFLLIDGHWREPYSWLGGLGGVFFTIGTQLLGGYSRYKERSVAKKLEITFKTWFLNVLLLVFIAYLNLASLDYERSVMLTWVVVTPFVILLLKLQINRYDRRTGKDLIQIAVLGREYEFTEFEYARLSNQSVELTYFDLCEPAELKLKILEFSPDYLVLNLETPVESTVIKGLTSLDLEGVQLIALHHFMETFLRKCFIPYQTSDLNYLERVTSYNRLAYLLKRTIDLSAAFTLGFITAPVMLYAVFKIKRESPGPCIFSQLRVGKSGQECVVYKFRSMHIDAEKNGAQFAQVDDPRAYKFGAFMRKTRIDELPQLWNVLRGDLHFIGPRPERKVFTDKLEEDIPYYNERHLVSPGITGWAQVLYPYGANTEDARQKLMYDLYYIKYWSIWLEIETIIRTVGVVLGRKGL